MTSFSDRVGTGLALLLVAATPSFALDKVKMTLAASDPIYAPYFVAIEKGYYREDGIEVEIVRAGGGTATPALISGSVQFSTSSASVVSAALKGAPLKVIMTSADRLPYKLYSTKPEIKTLKDLVGKSVGIQTRGDTFEVVLRQLLLAQNLDPSSVIFTPLGYGRTQRMAVIQSGSLPAVIISNLDEVALKASKVEFKGNLIVDITEAARVPYNGLATSDEFLKSNPQLVHRFLRATMKGMDFMRVKTEETVDILVKYNQETGRDLLKQGLVEAQESMTADGTVPDAEQMNEIKTRAAILKVPEDKAKPYTAVFDYGPVRKVNAELKASGWKP